MAKRAIRALMLGGRVPNPVATAAPEFRRVDPSTLFVDDAYQRDLSRRSMDLIGRIVEGWDWAKFKPPVVAETPDGLEVIDGQHTAIAAATHPGIIDIPVIVVEALAMADRARAFVGHNRDRLNITAVQMHHSAAAAGDEDATTINQVCERAGVEILRGPPPNGVFKPRTTLAIAAIKALINRRGAMGARKVLQAVAEANWAPVGADAIKAVDALMHDDEYRQSIQPEDITSTLMRMGEEAAKEARVFAAAHSVPIWRALAVTVFRNTRKRRVAAHG